MDSLPLQILVQILLILVNAFFAASEIAVLSMNKTKLRKQAEDGDKLAKRLLKFAETPANFLSTIQIGITLAGFLGSAFAADNFAGRLVDLVYNTWGWQAIPYNVLETIAIILITIILSYFTLVLGELVPKRIAMQKPYGVAKFTSRVISGLAIIMKPFIWFLSKSTNLVLRIFRLKVEAEEETVTEEEIKLMVDLGEETGTVEEKEKEWIQNIFEFNDTTVKEIMTPAYAVKYILLTDDKEKIIKTIRETEFSRIPVCKTGLNDIVGILHAKDFYNKPEINLENNLRMAYFVPETTLADDLFSKLQQTKNSFAVVVDEYGMTSGIVTMSDLLEEIVGKIYDEHDDEELDFEQIDENTYKVSGEFLAEDLAEKLDIKMELGEGYDTVGGLILSLLDYIPKDGTTVTVYKDGLELKATKIKNHRILEVVVKKEIKEEETE